MPLFTDMLCTCLALLFYDYLLTLDDEIRCVWKRRFSGVTVTFLALRYGTLLCAVCGAARIPLSGPGNDYMYVIELFYNDLPD